ETPSPAAAPQEGPSRPTETALTGPAAAGPSLPGLRQPALVRYHRTELHARGGIGEVWLARDERLDRVVALKELQLRWQGQEQMRRRFLAEAKVTGRLEHPGVVPVYDLVQAEGEAPCYAMRLVRGRTLAEAVRDYHDRGAANQAGPNLEL